MRKRFFFPQELAFQGYVGNDTQGHYDSTATATTILLRYLKAGVTWMFFLPFSAEYCLVSLFLKSTEMKLQKSYSWNGFIHRCQRRKHIISYVSLSISLILPPFCLWIGLPFQMRDLSYACPVVRNHINTSFLLPLSQQNDSFFSIMAMSVWNELYNQ